MTSAPDPQSSYPTPGTPPPAPAAPAPTARPAGPKTLGVVAFLAAIIAIVAGSILTYVGGMMAGGIARYAQTNADGSASIDTSAIPADAQAAFATGGVLVVVGFVVAGVFGLWALIQGIIAAVKNRGRGWGITAIVLAVLAFVPVSIFLGIGSAAGIASS